MTTLTAEALLAGSKVQHTIEIPVNVLNNASAGRNVIVRPLTIVDLQRISKSAQGDENLSATLLIQQALVEPKLSAAEVAQLPAGLARFLVERINAISGIDTPRSELEAMVQVPLAKACFVLAKEFGWTPEEVSGMTIGQILLYLEMIHQNNTAEQA
jgi:hypothetical protein